MDNPLKNCFDPRILVGDHQQIDQEMLVKILGLVGLYKVDTVNCGSDVLQALELRHYDLVFFNNTMPDMSGAEIVCHVKKRWDDEERPIMIAVINIKTTQDNSELRDAGFSDYVYTPLSVKKIRIVLAKWINSFPLLKFN